MILRSFLQRRIATVVICFTLIFIPFSSLVGAEEPKVRGASIPGGLWVHNNLFAWGLSVDSQSRTPEERAQMLERLGLRQVAYNWESKDIATFDEQIEAFKRHGIEIFAWSITDVDNPSEVVDWKTHKIQDMSVLARRSPPAPNAMSAGEMLEMFKRHRIAPQFWLIRRMRSSEPVLEPRKPLSEWTDEENNAIFRTILNYDPVSTTQEQTLRVQREANRVKALAKLAAPYGVKIGLYKHGGWIGISDNQVAIMERLKTLSVRNVGIVYQFIHAHDEVDDTTNFPAVWTKIRPYVLAVNVTGVHEGRTAIYPILYPSQGDIEVKMMKAIQDSGWKGPIGLCPEKGGDAEVNLRNNIEGIDWIAAELKQSGSGGPRPFVAGSP
jgi:hypothetical protein